MKNPDLYLVHIQTIRDDLTRQSQPPPTSA